MTKYIYIISIIIFTLFSVNISASNCETKAGTMPQDTLHKCFGDMASSQINSGWVNDGNDTLVYYLHEGNTDYIINPIDSNYTGIFNDSLITHNKTYYISSVAADTNSLNWINLLDTCLDVSVGTPVIWYKTSAGQKNNISCHDSFVLRGSESIDNSTISWSSNYAAGLSFNSTSSSVSSALLDEIVIDVLDKTVEIYLEEDNGHCILRDTIEVEFSSSTIVDFDYQQARCYNNQSKNDSTNFIFFAYPTDINKYFWDFEDAVIADSSLSLNSDTCNVFWKTDSIHIVKLVASNCPLDTIEKTITEIDSLKLSVKFDIIAETCNDENGKIVAHPMKANLPYYKFDSLYWDLYSQIPHYWDTIQKNMPSGEYIMNLENELCKVSETAIVKDSGLVKSVITVSGETNGEAEELEVTFINNSYGLDTIYRVNDTIITNPFSVKWIIQDQEIVYNNDTTYLSSVFYADSTDSDYNEISYNYLDSGKFTTFLIAISQEGCRDTSSFEYVNVEINSILGEGEQSAESNGLPNVFTPNGDGSNDKFEVKIQSLEYYEGHIYNRWGNKVYEWNSTEEEGWDGTDKWLNRPAPSGVYYYVIKGTGKDGIIFKDPEDYANGRGFKKESLTGFITLFRNKNFE